MKFNQWTLGLAALGVVSLTSAAQAEEKMSAVQAALSSTTISGYVDTSAQWNFGNHSASAGSGVSGHTFGGTGKADGFNLNVVQLTIAKALDESEWASGYRADLWMGPDAASLGSQSVGGGEDFGIRQAYVALRVPVGNGLDFKVGVFDTVVGYETLESGNNPNFTRSYGFTIEPTTHTGVLGTYRFNDLISASLGIANTFGPGINSRPATADANDEKAEESKTVLGSLALTAPEDWGWAAGSTLYVGIVSGFDNANPPSGAPGRGPDDSTHYYVGLTLATPVAGLKLGAAFDYRAVDVGDVWVAGLYASYQATEKLSFHGRAEYGSTENGLGAAGDADAWELTGTVQYDLWENVISRLEIRHDKSEDVTIFGRTGGASSATMLAANLIYKF
jgi:hypothetical protein